MRWVFNNPPADYVEAKRQALEDVEKRAAKKAERGREAEARRLVSPLEPEQAPASGCKRKNPGRHSKDEARLRMSGIITYLIPDAELCMKLKYTLNLFEAFSLQAILSTLLGCFGHPEGSQRSRCCLQDPDSPGSRFFKPAHAVSRCEEAS